MPQRRRMAPAGAAVDVGHVRPGRRRAVFALASVVIVIRAAMSWRGTASVRGGSRGRRTWWLLGLVAALAASASFALSGAAQADVDITGTWDCCGATGGASPQNFVITKGTGSLAGKAVSPSSGGKFATITGNLSGDKVKIVTTYTSVTYVATFVGTVSSDGRTMSGTWTGPGGQAGKWKATLASGPSTPTPVLAQSVAAATVSGQVLVEKPGTTTFVPLSAAGLLPVGSVVNATDGRVAITAASGTGHARHRGQFYGGEFKLGQAQSGVTNLTLTGGVPCGTGARVAARATHIRKQQLWGSGHGGDFKTSGTYAAATVLGTRWLTDDTCTATVIRVVEGEVRVDDFVTHRTVVIQAPGSYTAKP